MSEQQRNQSAPGGTDPMSAFWRDLWARSSAAAGAAGGMPGGMPGGSPGMPGMPGMPGAVPGAEAFAGAFTPEAMRRMQATFFEAMAQNAEQTMRSPQFLEAMKRSMDQALQFRRQMDDFLKSNMSTAFEAATGGANSEVMGAIRLSTTKLQEQIARIDERLSGLEATIGGKKPRASAAASTRRAAKTRTRSSRGSSSSSPKSRGKRRTTASKR